MWNLKSAFCIFYHSIEQEEAQVALREHIEKEER